MAKSINMKIVEIKEIVNWVLELYTFYDQMTRSTNNLFPKSLELRKQLDEKRDIQLKARDEIGSIHFQMQQMYQELERKSSFNSRFIFGEQLDEKAYKKFVNELYILLSKLVEINVISDLDEIIVQKVAEMRIDFAIVDIPLESTWKESLQDNPRLALQKLKEENATLQVKNEANKRQIEIAKENGGLLFVPEYLMLEESNEEE